MISSLSSRPSGLAAAITATRRGLDYHVIEKGALVQSIYDFPPQMVFLRRRSCSRSADCRSSRRAADPGRALKCRKVVDTFDLRIAFAKP